MGKKRSITKVIYDGLTVFVVLFASYLVLTFPADFILDLFWEKTGQVQIQNTAYNYGQFAGLPAGDGIVVLSGQEQFHSADSLEYYTFHTDSVIPLEAYRLKSSSDATDTRFRSGRWTVSSGVKQWDMYSKKAGFKRFLFNRYYLVRLPDGNYAAAFLDDGYYLRYRLAGSVQLPVGRAAYMEADEKKLLAPYLEEYGLDDERILIMFSQERYEQHKALNYLVLAAVWVVVLMGYILIVALAKGMLKKR
ncbi:MAG: hypothetical protein K2H91_14790 [Lachnospiraceae bacterium]|nr:hypothetical protein [Lachnospiraceae bacterium]